MQREGCKGRGGGGNRILRERGTGSGGGGGGMMMEREVRYSVAQLSHPRSSRAQGSGAAR